MRKGWFLPFRGPDERALQRAAFKLQARQGSEISCGSGFLVACEAHRRQGRLTLWGITCQHVLFPAAAPYPWPDLQAKLAGRLAAQVEVEALFPEVDLALLRFELNGEAAAQAAFSRLSPLKVADKMSSGQRVYVLGYPLREEQPSLRSGTLRSVESDCLEVDCPEGLGTGWSGGAVVSGRGRLLGVLQSFRNSNRERSQSESDKDPPGGTEAEAETEETKQVTIGYALPAAILSEKLLYQPLMRTLRRPRQAWQVVRSLVYGLLIFCGVLFLFSALAFWLIDPFHDPRLYTLAPQLSTLSYAITYESGATLQATFHPATLASQERKPPYLRLHFRGQGEADAGWVLVLWDKLFQNSLTNFLRKLHLEKKILVRGRNLEGFRTLILKLRGFQGGEPLGLGIKWIAADGTTHEIKLLLTHQRLAGCWSGPVFSLPEPISPHWQEIAVPLDAFGPVDWSSVENISLFWRGCFDERASEEGLIVDVAEIRLER